MLPILTEAQVVEVLREAQGRAVSVVDSPEWYCGERKSTYWWYDAHPLPEITKPLDLCAALAYSLRDKCLEYSRLSGDLSYWTQQARELAQEIKIEQGRKRQRTRVLRNLENSWLEANREVSRIAPKLREHKFKYFWGIEKRFLIEGN